ncbi:MAG: nicotinate (nicotinamide) nucleotide adenylyltransferase [Phycisphaerales bacterium]|nr:MAG: nicotinate (nicotinamide) nucleotide adenylyltransferase [Phycisphaerales bacterium]
MKRRIALFGGSFDPIHRGHVDVARVAAQQLQAQKVIFIPAKCSPLKGALPRASDDDRLRMVELIVATDSAFAASDCELRRAVPSYTIDTVRQFQADYGPETSIHWLLGADSVDDLVYWYKIDELIDACNVSVMYRGGYETPTFDKYARIWGAKRVQKLRANVVETPSIDISSTQVRERLAEGQDVSDMLHPDVADYIRRHNLYRRG